MQRFSAASFLAAILAVLGLSALIACSGTSNNANAVTQITLAPTTLSMNQGQVVAISATAQNSTGGTVAADISFTSSNTSLANVSSGALVCAGAWDANIITCTPATSTGQLTITASSGSVTASMTVYVHQQVDRVVASAPGNCISMGQTASMTATVLNITAPGCSPAVPCDITSQVGPITFGTSDASIVSVSSSGALTAAKPGLVSLFAGVSGVNSVALPYAVCAVSQIFVHSSTDSTTNFTLNPAQTQTLTADVYDTAGVKIAPTLTWGTNYLAVASAAVASTGSPGGTTTAIVPGNATITATCSHPDCNVNLPAQYSLNQVTVTVPGGGDTTVYAASTSSTSLVPISTSTNTAGTAITLPFVPNSIVASPTGKSVYIGSASTLMVVNTADNSVTTQSIPGVVLAVSPDGNYIVVSDNTNNVVRLFNTSTNATIFQSAASAPSAAFTPDSKTSWFFDQSVAFDNLVSAGTVQFNLPYVANQVAFNSQGTIGYFTSSSSQQVDVRSTCNQGEIQGLTAPNPTLIATLPNGNGAVVADSPNLDVVTTNGIQGGCPTAASSSLAPFNLGAGAFTAQQLFLSYDSSRAWLISNLPQLLGFNFVSQTPISIQLASGATPLMGGIRPDGQQIYIGASDGTVHRIDVTSLTDAAQISVGLKDSSGSAVNPNLVAVLP